MSIGSITYDLFIPLSEDHVESDKITLTLGSKHRIKDMVQTPGGGGANTATGMSKLGCSAAVAGVLGCDQWGETVIQELSEVGVGTDSITRIEDEITSFSIILTSPTGRRTILHDPGTNAHFHDVTFDKQAASEVDWVMLSRIAESACVIQDDLIEIFQEPTAPKLTWNPGGCQLEAGISAPNHLSLLQHTTVLMLNREEAMQFSQTESLEHALKSLIELGPEIVCITDGINGSYSSDGVQLLHCTSTNDLTVVETTGAGDAYTSAITWALIQGKSLPQAMQAGTINAASVLGHVGAQAGLLSTQDIETQLDHTPPTVSEATF